jgi:hypothetical protein
LGDERDFEEGDLDGECDFGEGDFGECDLGDEGDFGEGDLDDERDLDGERDFGEDDLGDERDVGEGDPKCEVGSDSPAAAHSFDSLDAFSFANSVFAGYCKRLTPAVLLTTLFKADFRGSPNRCIIPPGGINPSITALPKLRVSAIMICLSIFNMLQSHKCAVPFSQPVAKNLPLG